jgi:hypothetical protein
MRRLSSLVPWTVAAGIACAFVSFPRDARADAASVQRADDLFREAKALTDAGAYAPACPKLEESDRLDPALGTEFNLADCYEHTARPGKAYALFRGVADAAHAAGKDAREQSARARADLLGPRLGTVRLKLTTGALPAGARVTFDGVEVSDARAPQYLEPGHHLLQVNGAGSASWSTDVVVTARQTSEVTVPDLATVDSGAPPPSPPPSSAHRDATAPKAEGMSGTRVLSYALAGGSIVGLAVGGVAGAISLSEHDNAKAVCPMPSACSDAKAVGGWTRATTAGTASTVGFVSAGVLGVAALVVWFVARPDVASTSTSTSTSLRLTPSGVAF